MVEMLPKKVENGLNGSNWFKNKVQKWSKNGSKWYQNGRKLIQKPMKIGLTLVQKWFIMVYVLKIVSKWFSKKWFFWITLYNIASLSVANIFSHTGLLNQILV